METYLFCGLEDNIVRMTIFSKLPTDSIQSLSNFQFFFFFLQMDRMILNLTWKI